MRHRLEDGRVQDVISWIGQSKVALKAGRFDGHEWSLYQLATTSTETAMPIDRAIYLSLEIRRV